MSGGQPGLNDCQFIGRLAQDPVFVKGPRREADRAKFSIAVTARWKDKDGHLTSKVEYIDCIAWGNMARIFWKFIHKGYRVFVKGYLEVDRWVGNDGVKRRSSQIVVKRVLILQHPDKDREPPPPDAEIEEDESPQGEEAPNA